MTPPATGPKRHDAIALRLGLKKSAFPNLPASLKDAGLSYLALRLPGGKASLVELARLSVDDRVKAFVDAWDMLAGGDQDSCLLENVCAAVNIGPAEFVGEICRSAYRWNMDLSTLLAMMSQPAIVDKMTEFALEPAGHKDREMLLKSSGFLPLPKGSRTTIHVSAQAAAVAATENGLPSFEDDVTQNVRVIRGEVIDE